MKVCKRTLNKTLSWSSFIFGSGVGNPFGVSASYIIEEWHLHSISNNDRQNKFTTQNRFFLRLTARIHIEMSFIKVNNCGVKRDSPIPLIYYTRFSLDISTRADSDIGSGKMLLLKIKMVKHYRNYHYLIYMDFCVVTSFS